MYDSVIQAGKKLKSRRGNWAQKYHDNRDALIFVQAQFCDDRDVLSFIESEAHPLPIQEGGQRMSAEVNPFPAQASSPLCDLVQLDDTTSGHELATHIAALLNSGEGTIALAGDASGDLLRKLNMRSTRSRRVRARFGLLASQDIHSEAALVFDVPEGRDKPYTAAGKILCPPWQTHGRSQES